MKGDDKYGYNSNKTAARVSDVKDGVTEVEVSVAMDVTIAWIMVC